MLNKKIIAVAIGSVMAALTVTACTVDVNQLKNGLNELKDSVNQPAETVIVYETNPTDETVPTETETEEPEVLPTETPTPTPTATPTATPMPERVDFSDLTTDQLTEEFTVEFEAFEETYTASTRYTLATFSGSRMLVEIPDSENVQNAINLILDGFYQEAAGLYERAKSDVGAEYMLTGLHDNPMNVNVAYNYTCNGRIMSIEMSYSVTDNDTVFESEYEYFNIDMMTGQYINMNVITNDADALTAALTEALADETGEKAKDISGVYFMVSDDGITVYGTVGDETISADIDITDYSDLLNRYGKLVLVDVLFVEDDEEVTDEEEEEESDEEESDEEDENSDENAENDAEDAENEAENDENNEEDDEN